MSSPLFENIFGTYLTDRQLLAEFTGAQVESLQLSRASRFMSATLVCDRFIEIEKIDAAEKALSAALSLRGVELTPRYPADSLSVACFPTIVAFLRRRSAAVNGTFDDAVCRIEGDRLTVSLRHGCLNILRATKTDALLAEMLRTLFSRRMELQFEGDEGVDTADEHYQQMMAKAEEEAAASARAQAEAFRQAEVPAPTAAPKGEAPRPRKPVDPARPPACPFIWRPRRWCSALPSEKKPRR